MEILGQKEHFYNYLRAFDIERPRSPKVVPQWNLALVLQAFLKEPFESRTVVL